MEISKIKSKNLNLYLCGPTVYDDIHVGNLRPVIINDILIRVLKELKYNVKYVQNITDIDDKIIKKAYLENKDPLELSDFYFKEYIKILKKTNILEPTYMPKVSDNIEEIIKFIDLLIKKGFAYVSNGSVYFSLEKWEKYFLINNFNVGALKEKNSSKNLEKRDIKDFSLWKKTKSSINFPSPWGEGRPGWHTECSFFVYKYFGGETLDFHSGGIDLKFPHHLNEMAQFETLTKKPLAKEWIYIGHVTSKDQKMSKSLNNSLKVKDFLEFNTPNVLRFILINSNYSKPLNFEKNLITNGEKFILKIKNVIFKYIINNIENKDIKIESLIDKKFLKIISNDLDTPNSLTYLSALISDLNKDIKNEVYFKKIIFILSTLGFNLKIDVQREKIIKILQEKDYKSIEKIKERMVIL